MILSIQGKNKFYKCVDDVSDIVDDLKQNQKRILSINLSGNVFNPEPLEALFKEIFKLKKLRSAILVGIFSTLKNETMLECLSIVSSYLPTKSLEILDLSDNALSCKFPDIFRKFIGSLDNLRILKLNNCGLGELGGNWLADSLMCINNKDNLESIEIAQNKFMNFPKNLGIALENFTYLEEIKIQYNTIDQDSLDGFLRCFENHSLRKLDIRDNFLSIEGCKMLGDFFVNWCMEEMKLGDCLMGTEGLKAFLSRASKKRNIPNLHGGLRKSIGRFCIDLSFNDIDQEGINELTKFIKSHKIDTLSIQGNEYDDCNELINLFKSNGGNLIHDYESENVTPQNEEEILIKKLEQAL